MGLLTYILEYLSTIHQYFRINMFIISFILVKFFGHYSHVRYLIKKIHFLFSIFEFVFESPFASSPTPFHATSWTQSYHHIRDNIFTPSTPHTPTLQQCVSLPLEEIFKRQGMMELCRRPYYNRGRTAFWGGFWRKHYFYCRCRSKLHDDEPSNFDDAKSSSN